METTAAAAPPFHTSGIVRLTRPQLVGTMTGLVLAMLLAALDQTIVGTAEPRIIASLSGFNRYPWVATAYMLTSTIVVPIIAKLSDLFGRKWFFLWGAAVFVATSALCGASGDLNFTGLDGMNQLILFRGLQGIGAGAVMGLIFVIVGDIFSPAERGRYQGYFSGVWGVAAIFGPTLGGWLTDHFSWRATFYVNLPVGLIAIAAIYFEFPDIRPQGLRKQLDYFGSFALIACMTPLLLAFTWVTDYGWGSARVAGLLIFSAAMLGAFLYAESHAAEPLIPLTLFRDPVIRICSTCVFVLGMGMFGVIIYLPLFMQGVLGVSATQSGALMTPMMLGAVTGSFMGGQLTYRLQNYKVPGILGSGLATGGMIFFANMNAATPQLHVVLGMILAGLGMGLLQPVYTVAVQNVAPRAQMGAATASTIFFRAIGSTMGVAVFGSVLLTNYHAEFRRGIPPGVPPEGLKFFDNPLLLVQMRTQMEALFGQYPGGLALMQQLMANVRGALVHGLHLIFVTSAFVMGGTVVLNILLKSVPLRAHHNAPREMPVAEL
jgi:EmrB/QacA subfamily drug resistance transporter